MAQCSVCRVSGGNMKQCEKCNSIWCVSCALKEKDHYPKARAANVCPYCGANKVRTFR